MLLIFILILFLIILWRYKTQHNGTVYPNKGNSEGKLPVPLAPGSLPILGHSLPLLSDPIKFLKNSRSQCGPVFKIRLFTTTITFVADQELIKNHYFPAPENVLSATDFFNSYFMEAFYSRQLPVAAINNVVKKSLRAVYHDEGLLPLMEVEAENFVAKLKSKAKFENTAVDLKWETSYYLTSIATRSILGIPVSEEIMQDIQSFINIADNYISWKFVLPSFLPEILLKRTLLKRRIKIVMWLMAEISKQQVNKDSRKSHFFSAAFDESSLTDKDIAELTVSILHTILSNTGVGLINLILDVSTAKKEILKGVRKVVEKYEESKDVRDVLENKLIHASVLESARLNPNFMTIVRQPKESRTIGPYDLGSDTDIVSICQILTQIHSPSVPHYPTGYNPKRFITGSDSFGHPDVMAWSGGPHICPGKLFAINEMKIALAHFLLNFQIDVDNSTISEPDVFSCSSFADRKIVKVKLNFLK